MTGEGNKGACTFVSQERWQATQQWECEFWRHTER
jgi:hypothetical protein